MKEVTNRFADNTWIKEPIDSPEKQNYIQQRNSYWRRLRAAQAEFNKLNDSHYAAGHKVFKEYLLDMYGVEMHFEGTNIAGHFNIADEKKYLIFLMRFDV